MRTILIPVDFSSGTLNALDYIAQASKDIAITKVILLKSRYNSVYQPIVASAEYFSEHNFEAEMREATEHINSLSRHFLEKVSPSVKVVNAITELPLPRAILETIKQEQPDLMVLHSATTNTDGYITDNLIELVTISAIPVLVVPAAARYRKITNALVPVDFEALHRLSAFSQPLLSNSTEKPILTVFSIKSEQQRDDADDFQNLSRLLKGFSFSIHYSKEPNILEGILRFADSQDPDLIVALPGVYNFFKNLTHRSIAKAITIKSSHPVLILKQNK